MEPVDSLAIFKLIEFLSSNKALKEIELTTLLFQLPDNKLNHLIGNSSYKSKLNQIRLKLKEGKFNKFKKRSKNNNASFFRLQMQGLFNVFAADSAGPLQKNRYY